MNYENEIREYLNNLQKEELIEILLKNATCEFKKELEAKFSDSSEKLKILNRVENEINSLFNDEELLHSPYYFEEELINSLHKLKPIQKYLSDKVFNTIYETLENIDDAFDGGYLYDDYSDGVFETERLLKFVIDFLKNSESIKKLQYLDDLSQLFNNFEYESIENIFKFIDEIFSANEKRELKDEFTKLNPNFQQKIYKYFKNVLSDEDREKSTIQSGDTIELSNLYEEQDKISKAIEILEKKIKDNIEDRRIYEYISKRFDLALIEKKDILKWARELAKYAPYGFAKEYFEKILDNIENKYKSEFEDIFKNKNIGSYIEYLEENERLNEVVEIFETTSRDMYGIDYEFFKRYKEKYPKEALKNFLSRFNTYSQNTGDDNYEEVANILEQIKSIDYETFMDKLGLIKNLYWRRRNLIKILQSKFKEFEGISKNG